MPEKEDGEFILCLPCGICWMDTPYEDTDPRMIWPSVKENYGMNALPLFLKSFDSTTMTCTFEPSGKIKDLPYEIGCNEQHVEWADIPSCFEFHPSAWLRPSTSTSSASLNGLELAARPDRHPPIGVHCLFPSISYKGNKESSPGIKYYGDDEGGTFFAVDVEDKPLRPGDTWTISYRAVRFDGKAQMERTSLGIDVPALLRVEKLEVPFIDLFAPHRCLEVRGYYEM